MSIFPKGVYTAVKAALEASSDLSYVDAVVIRKYRRDNLPDFNYYCIILSPAVATAVPYPAAHRWIENQIEVILLGKMLNGEADAIMADSPSASPPNVGILAMYEDVFRSLYENNLSGEIELIPGLTELDAPAHFDVIFSEDREGFIMEARMLYQPKGQRFVNLT